MFEKACPKEIGGRTEKGGRKSSNKEKVPTKKATAKQASTGKEEMSPYADIKQLWPKKMYGGQGTLEKLDMYQSKPRQTVADNEAMTPEEVSTPQPPLPHPPPHRSLHLTVFKATEEVEEDRSHQWVLDDFFFGSADFPYAWSTRYEGVGFM